MIPPSVASNKLRLRGLAKSRVLAGGYGSVPSYSSSIRRGRNVGAAWLPLATSSSALCRSSSYRGASSPSTALLRAFPGNQSLRGSLVTSEDRRGASSTRSFSSQPPGGGGGGGGGGGVQLPSWLTGQQQPEGQYLKDYTTDLTDLARKNKLDPVIGRHDEINRVIQILSRKTKNCPVLIGSAGVGKTAIAEGLASRIASGEVPESMRNKQVLSLDMTQLMSSTAMRGQLEERMKGLLRDLQAVQPILFVDELHTIVNAGKTEGSMDMSNMLKPYLARGEISLVGATTLDEYRIIEKDSALARRFQSVYVAEPSVEDTISILRGIKTSYELFHGLRIQDDALVAAAVLSDRYLTDRYQPDKSIDLVDEACSRLRLEQESKPEILWKVERDLLTKQIELSAIENDVDAAWSSSNSTSKSSSRKAVVEGQVKELQAEVQRLTDLWQAERKELSRAQDLKKDLERARTELDQARREGNFNRAGELMHGTIPQLERELHDAELTADRGKPGGVMLSDAVTPDAIATIVARHTGIPVSKIAGSKESTRLLHLEDSLRKRVVGQDHALEAVGNCVRLARTRLQAHNRTLGNFLFLGPTGVGKTETAKALAEFLFDNETHMTRIDLSEYGEKHTVSRLIGSPPGYVGYEEGGALTESVRRRPYQVLLLDEFEKAHPDVWNLLLQLFDEGRLTDSHGRTVDFRNVIVIMTSNIGAHLIQQLPESMKGSEPEAVKSIMEIVRSTLSPELLNRIDETVVFNRLQRENMDVIAAMGIQEIAKRLEDSQNMTLDVSETAHQVLSEMGYDIRYGARPLKRTLAKELLNPLSRLVLEGAVREGDAVRVRTRAEAEREQKYGRADLGWISSNSSSDSKNDVVIIRNHEVVPEEDKTWDDEEFLLEDGTHKHR